MVRHGDQLAFTLGIVFDNQFHRVDNGHRARGVFVKIFANAGFKGGHLDGVVLLGHADAFAELTNRGCSVTTTTQTRDGWHTWVIPALNVLVGHQQVQLTLGHHGVFQIQTRELVLAWMHRNGDVIQHPVVQTTVVLELQRTQGVRNAFQRIADAVRKVVHRVDAPLVAGLMVFRKLNAVQHRIAHHDERRRHVDFGTQARFAFFEATGTHFFKQRKVLFHAAIAERAVFARRGQRTAIFTDFISRQFVNIRQTLVDQFNRVGVQLIKIVRGVADIARPVEAQPLHVILDGLNVFDVFFYWVGVIETQVALSLVVLRNAKVQADGLRMPDMQVAVRLRRETGMNCGVLTTGQIFIDDLTNKVTRAGFCLTHRGFLKA